MAGSNPPPDVSASVHEDLRYLYASNANVSNFVTVKLSGNQNYSMWKTQMLCLMTSHRMRGIVDSTCDAPRSSSTMITEQYESLLKGWIFGSISEDVLVNVMDLPSAKDVWDKLDLMYGFQQDAQEETKDKDAVSSETEITTKGRRVNEEEKERMELNKKLSRVLSTETTKPPRRSQLFLTSFRRNMNPFIRKDLAETKSEATEEMMDKVAVSETQRESQQGFSMERAYLSNLIEIKAKEERKDKDAISAKEESKDKYAILAKEESKDKDVILAKEESKDKDVVSVEKEMETKGKISRESEKNKDKKERMEHIGYGNMIHHIEASRTNVSNFVSVKLSGIHNYSLWKTQMLCLLETHNICGILDAKVDHSKALTPLEEQYNKLVRGWIFGSVSEDVLGNLVHLKRAKEVWDTLQSFFDPTMSSQQAPEGGMKGMLETKNDLRKATMKGCWSEVENILKRNKDLERAAINSDGSTILHLAVGIGHNNFVRDVLRFINEKGQKGDGGEERKKGKEGQEGNEGEKRKEGDEGIKKGNEGKEGGKDDEVERGEKELLTQKNNNGNTALHIAAIVGNLGAAKLLVRKDRKLLTIENKKGETPLHKACSSMQCETFTYLYREGEESKELLDQSMLKNNNTEIGVELLANAISAKQYSAAFNLLKKFPVFAVENDHVLMAIATTFPSGLTRWEKLVYPESLHDMGERIIYRTSRLFSSLAPFTLLHVPLGMLHWFYQLIRFLALMAYLPFFLLYSLSWNVAITLGAPIKRMKKRKNDRDEAKMVLKFVFELIDKSEEPFDYSQSILRAACQNAYQVVDEILFRSPEAIMSMDKNGHDIIQLAVLHRSERIYNIIYQSTGEHKSHYRTCIDNSRNNILHLAARLAPSHKLNCRTGAALQLQRELQWCEELKKLVCPTHITKENIFKETPDMVFTREHAKLVKEGEKWMKTTAESCSITAALITTIVFAAAIAVPGGSNQQTGIPLLTNDIAFTIFAISDMISLFTSTTSLLVFLSILTARFAEQDFLLSLPSRLILGLYTLLLSATSMMVAFSATLFLVFCHRKPWMLAPICGSACLPIVFFFIVQFPLIVDLLLSTYGRPFGKKSNRRPSRFNPDDVQGFFST